MTRRSPRILIALAASAAILVTACGSGGATTTPSRAPSASADAFGGSGTSGGPSGAPSASAPASGGTAAACPTKAPAAMAKGQTRTVTIATPKGNIVIKVEGSLGPRAAGNFVALASCGYYSNVVFHRVLSNFVIQGGDGEFGRLPNISDNVGGGGPGYTFADDPVAVAYTRGTVAMANSGPNTNGSQFFIVLSDNPGLDPLYSIFGHVTAGMDAVDAIAAGPSSGGQAGRATNPVPMTSVTVSNP